MLILTTIPLAFLFTHPFQRYGPNSLQPVQQHSTSVSGATVATKELQAKQKEFKSLTVALWRWSIIHEYNLKLGRSVRVDRDSYLPWQLMRDHPNAHLSNSDIDIGISGRMVDVLSAEVKKVMDEVVALGGSPADLLGRQWSGSTRTFLLEKGSDGKRSIKVLGHEKKEVGGRQAAAPGDV